MESCLKCLPNFLLHHIYHVKRDEYIVSGSFRSSVRHKPIKSWFVYLTQRDTYRIRYITYLTRSHLQCKFANCELERIIMNKTRSGINSHSHPTTLQWAIRPYIRTYVQTRKNKIHAKNCIIPFGSLSLLSLQALQLTSKSRYTLTHHLLGFGSFFATT